MTPSQAKFIAAKRARDARFAEAALRQIRREQERTKPLAVISVSEERRRYREYATASRISAYVPMSKRILNAIAMEFCISVPVLLADNRRPHFTNARYFAVALFLELTPMSLPAIGKHLNRDHTTILHARETVRELLQSEALRNRLDEIKSGITA